MAENFEKFYRELQTQKEDDAVLTSEQQLNRLTRPEAEFLNLNPFEVLQISIGTELEAAKKKYKKLSLLIHPDKNPDDSERAGKAFDTVKKAILKLEDPEQLAFARGCYAEGQKRLNKMKVRSRWSRTAPMNERESEKALWVIVTKVFANREKKRKMLEEMAVQRARNEAATRAAYEEWDSLHPLQKGLVLWICFILLLIGFPMCFFISIFIHSIVAISLIVPSLRFINFFLLQILLHYRIPQAVESIYLDLTEGTDRLL